jgi:hypothetical protein
MNFKPKKIYAKYFRNELPIQWFSVEDILSNWKSVDCVVCEVKTLSEVLDVARKESNYNSVKNSLKKKGFIKPLCFNAREKMHMDGHHRLAAAIDLGFKWIPYIDSIDEVFLKDIGIWRNPNNEPLLHPENPVFSNLNKEQE